MGFTLACPQCGVRSYHEFWFGGELRPWNADATPAEDYRSTWLRTNHAGPQVERWFHYAGCSRWFTAARDTTTNAILGITSTPRPSDSSIDTFPMLGG
jgi:heterotetrameric sarcosine oxidase delta subunit